MIKEPMTRRRIEQYSNLQREIAMLEDQIYSAQLFGTEYVTDVVMNSQRPLVIKGYGSRAIPRLCERKAKYEAECDAVECFIEEVEDSVLRQILIRRYIEGHTIEETGELTGYSESTVKRLTKDFFGNMNQN